MDEKSFLKATSDTYCSKPIRNSHQLNLVFVWFNQTVAANTNSCIVYWCFNVYGEIENHFPPQPDQASLPHQKVQFLMR